MGDEGDDLAAAASKDPAVTPGEDANQPPGDEEVQAIDFYISYREDDSVGYNDRDLASRLAGALQKEKRADGSPISVFAPDGEAWDVRLKHGLEPSSNIILLVSEGGLRTIRDADRGEDVTLLEYEYSLAQKLKGKKRVMLLLVKDKSGANFSSFSTEVFPGGEVAKIAQSPCHKSKKSASLWDAGGKKDLLIPDNKPGEHSIRMTMEELFRLQGINISMKSSDIKAVVPTIVAMLKLKLPDIPTEKLELQTSERVREDTDKLTSMLSKLGDELLEAEPILKAKFGIGSIEDLAGLQASNLGEPLLVDAGKIVVCDQKTLQTVVVDNEEGHYDMDAEKWVVRALKLVSFESHVPALPAEPLSQKVHIAGLKTTSTVSALGKKIRIGNEDRVITHVDMSLFMVGENEEGKPTYTEITEEMVAKAKALRDKSGVPEPPCADGKVHLYGRYTLSHALTRENSACEKDKIRDRVNSSQAADYVVECNLSQEQIASLQKATQTSLGVSPGGVSLAQTYGNLFEHRIKKASTVGELNQQLMDSIKSSDARMVGELLRQKASCNFKDSAGWSPLHRACSARLDSGDLGTSFIACNQIVEILIKAGADVNQTNSYGKTALHYAAIEGNFYSASVLVHSGANVDCKDQVTVPDLVNGGIIKGATPAFHAKLHKKNDWEKVVQLCEVYTNEPPPPKVEKAGKGKKGKKKK